MIEGCPLRYVSQCEKLQCVIVVLLTETGASQPSQRQRVNSELVILPLDILSNGASQTVQSENVQCSIVALYKESTRVLAVIFLNVHFVRVLAFPANKWVLPVLAFFS